MHPRDPDFRYGAAVCRLRLRDLAAAAVRPSLAADPDDRRLRSLARDLGLPAR